MREESSFPDPERIIIATAFEQSIQTALSPVLRNIKLRNLHRFYEDPRIYAARALNESGKRLFYACLDPGSISPDTPFRGLPFSPRCFLEIAKIDPASHHDIGRVIFGLREDSRIVRSIVPSINEERTVSRELDPEESHALIDFATSPFRSDREQIATRLNDEEQLILERIKARLSSGPQTQQVSVIGLIALPPAIIICDEFSVRTTLN